MYLCDSLQAFHQCWYGGTTGQTQIFYRKVGCWFWLGLVLVGCGLIFFSLALGTLCAAPKKLFVCPRSQGEGTGCDLPEPHTALRAPRGTIPDQLPLSVLAG